MKKIVVVTVNYNSQNYTRALLKSLEKVEIPNISLEIIVVDNGSKETLETFEDKHSKVIRLDRNMGFSGGYNTGIKEALKEGAAYVLIINNDTIVNRDLIKNLLEVLEGNEKIGVTTPKIYFAKGHEYHEEKYKIEDLGKILWYAGGYTDWYHVKSVHRGVDEVDHGQYNKTEQVEFASGCCMMIKREVLEKTGLFDERYFLYYEDADLIERIKNAGYVIYYVPEATLAHFNASSTGGPGGKLHDYFLTRNQMLFGMKYAPVRSKLALIKQSLRLLFSGRPYQKRAIRDFYTGKFGKGSYFDKTA